MRWAHISGILVFGTSIASGTDPEPQVVDQEAPATSPMVDDQGDLYNQFFRAGNYVEAIDIAKVRVSEVLAQNAGDREIAVALTRLANAQRLNGHLVAAAENYRDAISRIQVSDDMLSMQLVAPLVGVADVLMALGDYPAAEATYDRAAHITRVNQGPANLDQVEILSKITDLYAAQGLHKDAYKIQGHQLQVLRRSLEETDPRVIEAWRRQGELLGLSGQHHDAQEMYGFAADIVRTADGQHSLAQIPLLNDLSNSYLRHANADQFTRLEMARAELERIISITESNSKATPQQRANAYLRMGDLMLRYGDPNSAIFNYRQAWKNLPDDTARSSAFGSPVLLNPSALDSVKADNPDSEEAISEVRVYFDVSRNGEAENQRVAEELDKSRTAKRALTASTGLRYRPRFFDGDPVETRDMFADILVDTN